MDGLGAGGLSEQEREGQTVTVGHRPSSQQGVEVTWLCIKQRSLGRRWLFLAQRQVEVARPYPGEILWERHGPFSGCPLGGPPLDELPSHLRHTLVYSGKHV